jgi:hypothetical protein
MEAGMIRNMDLFALSRASEDFTIPLDAFSSADSRFYGPKRNMGPQETVDRYRAFMDETIADDIDSDLLLLHWHLPATSGGGMGHYIFCVVSVGQSSVVARYDSLKNEGRFDLQVVSLQEYNEKMCNKYPGISMASMQILKGSAQRPGTVAELLKDGLKDFNLAWCSWTAPNPIQPLKIIQSFPTCAFDVCIAHTACVDALCHNTSVWPQTLTKARWTSQQLDVSIDSENDQADRYWSNLRAECMHAMCLLRSVRARGVFWPGNANDSEGGLSLYDVQEHVLGLLQPEGHYFAAGFFDNMPPSEVTDAADCAPAEHAPFFDPVTPSGPTATREQTLAAHRAAHRLAQEVVRSKKAQQWQKHADVFSPGRTSRADEHVRYMSEFSDKATRAVVRAFSGQQDLSDDAWCESMQANHTVGNLEEARAHMEDRRKFGENVTASILWVDDVRHPGFQPGVVLLGAKLRGEPLKMKAVLEQEAVKVRPYNDVVPFLPNMGRAVSCAAYQYIGPGSKGFEASETAEAEVIVQVVHVHVQSVESFCAVALSAAGDNDTGNAKHDLA